jgi:hypothetical protein
MLPLPRWRAFQADEARGGPASPTAANPDGAAVGQPDAMGILTRRDAHADQGADLRKLETNRVAGRPRELGVVEPEATPSAE